MLEALSQLACAARPVLFVAYDTEARGPLATVIESRGLLAAGLVLAPEPGGHAHAMLEWRLCAQQSITTPRSEAARDLAGNGMSGCIPFFEALAVRERSSVCLALQSAMQIDIEVQPTA